MNDNQILYVNSICDNVIFCQYKLILSNTIDLVSRIKRSINHKEYSQGFENEYGKRKLSDDIKKLDNAFKDIESSRLNITTKDDLTFCINEIKDFLEGYLVMMSF